MVLKLNFNKVVGVKVKNSKLLKLFFSFLIALPSFIFASGGIKGVVTDSLTNERLVGANVILVGTSLGAASNIEGEYSVLTIPPGQYILKCSYLGYKPKEISVTIVDNKTVELNFELLYNSVQGEEVIITAQAQGQAAAINQQLTSNTIVNVISEQKIKELPDANAAEALGRLPGVSIIRSGGEANKITLRGLNQNLTTITLDGVKLSPTDADSRGIDLSTISQGSLSGIVLSKAITSDMEAEAIAGNINFVTRTAPEIREIQVDAFGSYSAIENSAEQYNFLGRYGERFFDNSLGVQLFGNLERRVRSSEQYNVGIDELDLTDPDYQISDFQLKYTPEIRKRAGGKLLLDYRTPDNGIIKFNTEYNRTERRLSTIDRNYPITAGDVTFNFRGQDINTEIMNIALHGENYISDWQINWNMSYSESGSDTPYDYFMHLNEPSASANGEVVSGMYFVPENLRHTTDYEKLIPYALNNFDVAYFNRVESRISSNLDFEKTIFLDAKKAYNVFGFSGEVKFGGKYRSKYHRRKTTLRQGLYYNGIGNGFYNDVKLSDGSIVPKDFAAYGYEDLKIESNLILLTNFLDSSTRDLFGQYLLNPLIDADRVRDWYNLNINGFNKITNKYEYPVDNSDAGTNYNLTESISSGYIMNTLNIGTLATFIAGVRFEHDNNSYNAFYTNEEVTEFSVFSDTSTTHNETIVLPNFHLILKPTDFMNLRFAAYRGIERPNFNYRLPTYIYGRNRVGGSGPYVKLGNPDLTNADAWNFEVNSQFFGNTIGLFSISAFYKKIENQVNQLWFVPIQNKETADSLGIVYPSDVPPFSTAYSLSYPYNTKNATRVWGFEFEHQLNFRYLPGLLSNIVLSYNFSIIKTESYTPVYNAVDYFVQLPGSPFPTKRTRVEISEAKTRTANSPELFGNVSLGYDIGGFSGRISYFYQSEYYNVYSGNSYANNIQKEFGRLDLSLKQQINDMLSVGLNVNNLTDAEEGAYLENKFVERRNDIASYRYGTTADLWLRVTL